MQSSRSPKDTSVKFFTSEMVGAPSLSEAAGTLIGVLSACLVNGFGMQQVSSFVVTQGLGQITVPVATGWKRMCVIDVAGCTDASYNGEYKLTQVSADGLRVSFPIDAPDGTVLGAAITVKLAPAGWLLRFADPATNKAVYMPGTPQWAGHCLRVQDPQGTHSFVRGYESMSDVDTGLGMFPTTAQVATSAWSKASGTARPARWLVVADERLMYVGLMPVVSSTESRVASPMRWFGRFDALNASDMHAVSVSVQLDTLSFASESWHSGAASLCTAAVSKNIWVARSLDGAIMSQGAFVSLLAPYAAASGEDGYCGSATGVGVGNLVGAQKFLRVAVGSYPRAKMPAIMHLMHTGVEVLTPGPAVVDIGGRLHWLFAGSSASGTNAEWRRICAIDVEGPWS
ncbi:hypothetical protein [Comamonas jiangduensis]|uniref:Uncharacterized protein n=1 Tax=Comamonas jiangduensis TaxID=1194168 RepID=A0ABV4IEN6_9BURK